MCGRCVEDARQRRRHNLPIFTFPMCPSLHAEAVRTCSGGGHSAKPTLMIKAFLWNMVPLVLVACVVAAAVGCGGGGAKAKTVRLNLPPREPPPVPARRNVPIDAALQAAARQEVLA